MTKIQKIFMYFAFLLGTVSVACVAWLDNPPWAHNLFMSAWVIAAITIVAPMIFSNQFGVMSWPFRIFGIGFIILAFQGVANYFGASLDFPWLHTIGTVVCVIGVVLGIFKASESQDV